MERLPQLRMRRRLHALPARALPEGYTCRRLRAGEEAAWAAVLNGCGELGAWDEERIAKTLAGGITPGRIWFLCAADQPIATACVRIHPGEAFGLGRSAFGSDRSGVSDMSDTEHRTPPPPPSAQAGTPKGCGEGRPAAEAEIGWVAVVPEHQGRGLGGQITLAACHAARELGFDEAFLFTDDFRLPAIKTYLNLGFTPDCWHESHAGRWTAILRALGYPDEATTK